MRFFVLSAFALALLANNHVSAQYRRTDASLAQYGGDVGAEESAIDEYSKKNVKKGLAKDGWMAEKRLEEGHAKFGGKQEYAQEGKGKEADFGKGGEEFGAEGGYDKGKEGLGAEGGYGKGKENFGEAGYGKGQEGFGAEGGYEKGKEELGAKGGYGKGKEGFGGEAGFEKGKEGLGAEGGYGKGMEGPGAEGGYENGKEGLGAEGGYGKGKEGPGAEGGYGKGKEGLGAERGYGKGMEGPGAEGGYGKGKEGFGAEGGYGKGKGGFGGEAGYGKGKEGFGGEGGFEGGKEGFGGEAGYGKGKEFDAEGGYGKGKGPFGGEGITGIEGYDGPKHGMGMEEPGFGAGWKGGYDSGMMHHGKYGGHGGHFGGGMTGYNRGGNFGGFDELPRPFGRTKMTVKTCNKMMDSLLGSLQTGYAKHIAPVVKLPQLPPTPLGGWGKISFYDGAFQNLKGKICRGGDFKVIPQGDTVLVSGIVSIPEPRIRYQADAFLYNKLKVRNRPMHFCAKNADFKFEMAVNKKAGMIHIGELEPLKVDGFHFEDEKGDPKHLVWPFNKIQGPALEESKITFANQLTGVLCDEFRTMVKRPEVKEEILNQV